MTGLLLIFGLIALATYFESRSATKINTVTLDLRRNHALLNTKDANARIDAYLVNEITRKAEPLIGWQQRPLQTHIDDTDPYYEMTKRRIDVSKIIKDCLDNFGKTIIVRYFAEQGLPNIKEQSEDSVNREFSRVEAIMNNISSDEISPFPRILSIYNSLDGKSAY
jgi:hypothetical protein